MQSYGRLMAEVADRTIDTWTAGRPFPVHPHLQAITLDVILRAVFGLAEGAAMTELRVRLVHLIGFVMGPAGFLLFIPVLQLDLGPLSPGGRFTRLAGAVDEMLFAEIARRRAAGTAGRADILSMLIEARYEDGSAMSDQALRDEMITLLLAGHETTATALAWVLHDVLPRPDVLAELRAELARVVGDGPFGPEHVGGLAYMDAVLKESARLHPVVPNVGRLLKVPTRIGDHLLPAGVVAAPCMYLSHHRADVWAEPERFQPERFVGARPGPYAFFPFGGGLRRCIGAAFATYEMKVVLARILARVELRPARAPDVQPVRRTITLAPSRGMPVIVDAVGAR
jgi:cytochrome P450